MNAKYNSQVDGITVTLADSEVIINAPEKEEIAEILEAVFGHETPNKQ